MTSHIMSHYVDHFLGFATRGDLLLMDNLNAHKSPVALEKLRVAGVSVLFFPPYMAYLMSPLDNFIFATIKNDYRDWVRQTGGEFSPIDKEDFITKKISRVLMLCCTLLIHGYMWHAGVPPRQTTSVHEQTDQ